MPTVPAYPDAVQLRQGGRQLMRLHKVCHRGVVDRPDPFLIDEFDVEKQEEFQPATVHGVEHDGAGTLRYAVAVGLPFLPGGGQRIRGPCLAVALPQHVSAPTTDQLIPDLRGRRHREMRIGHEEFEQPPTHQHPVLSEDEMVQVRADRIVGFQQVS